MDILCCLFIWGFFLFVSLLTINFGILAVPDLLTLSDVFRVHGLCFSISASIWAFSMASLFASLSFICFCICILLAFASTSLSASFSWYCFTVFVALFLSCLDLSPQAILSISLSSSSGTFCLCIFAFVLGFIYSLRAEHLSVFALSFSSCLSFCPHVLYAIIFVLARSK